MKVNLFTFALALALGAFSAQAIAHDFWAEAKAPKVNQKLTASIGYGHNFPEGEDLKAEDLNTRFIPPKVYGENGELALAPGEKNTAYNSVDKLAPGYYVIATQTNGTFFTRSEDGYASKPKNEVKGAKSCSYNTRFGKEVIKLGAAKNQDLATKPFGQTLEFVPQADPTNIKVGQPFPVKILYQGQPLRGAEVSAYLAGLVKNNAALFFQANTSPEGIVNLIALKAGDWLAKVTVEEPYQDKKVCDTSNATASFTFRVHN
ncbi:MAG: DUF4198 domain-containing protein [Deltaproteobacteria bacterium]|jgi:uncharacterized GH25 family protein|nr:DUF4198 domain-containing protein [Deltaproteobacteria bacterium]